MLTVLRDGNTAIYPTSSSGGRAGLVMYALKYLSKNQLKPGASMPIVVWAKLQIDARTSVAYDTGTAQRTATHWLTKTLLKVRGMEEKPLGVTMYTASWVTTPSSCPPKQNAPT